MYKWLKGYFTISKREFNGMLVFVVVMIGIFLIPFFYERFMVKPIAFKIQTLQPAISQIESNGFKTKQPYFSSEDKHNKGVLFNFNPNTLGIDGWVKLGLSNKQASSILNYVAKGGKFFTKNDVKKMYAISTQNFTRLEPYIQIPEKSSYDNPKFTEKTSFTNSSKSTPSVIIEINDADSATLTSINGIGAAFASRILKYRNRIGGFATSEQLKEVYGLDSLKFDQIKNQIKVNPSLINKININTAEFDEFKKIPYLTYKQMNAIINYRKQHGKFLQLSDIENIVILSPNLIKKIAPYVQF